MFGLATYIRSGFSAAIRKENVCTCYEIQVIRVCSKSNKSYFFSLYWNLDLDDSIYCIIVTCPPRVICKNCIENYPSSLLTTWIIIIKSGGTLWISLTVVVILQSCLDTGFCGHDIDSFLCESHTLALLLLVFTKKC